MTTFKEQYAELLSLTKNYLQQEYSSSQRIFSEQETYAYFKAYALQKKQPAAQPPILKPQKNAPAPICAPNPTIPLRAPKPLPESPPVPAPTPSKPLPDPLVQKNPPSPPLAPETKIVESEKVHKDKEFTLDVPPLPSPADFSDLRKIIQEKIPHVHARLINTLPSDSEAKVLGKLWTQEKQIPQVLILSFDEVPKHQTFLANICKALEVYGVKTQVDNAHKLERSNGWQALLESKEMRLVLASSAGFYHLDELQKHYREGNKQGRHFLGDRPLLLLSDISFYLKEPSLKPSLWAAIKEILATNPRVS